MNCKEINKLIPDYLDNILTKDQAIEFQKHLNSCSKCIKLIEQVKSSYSLLKPTKNISEPAFYYTRLKQKMENMYAPKESIFKSALSRKVFQPIIYLASLVIAVYIGILIGSNPTTADQFSENNTDNIDYLETFAEYQYLNDFETEPIENLIIEDEDSK
ncbi:zf-HC2 domain-containing protein [Bacteroidota bacterium]